MKATSRRLDRQGFRTEITVRGHHLTADEPRDKGGEDQGPDPQEYLAVSLASCMAITMEMYAKRKGWDIGEVEVDCEYTAAERGCPTTFKSSIRLAGDLDAEQIERLRVIAAKCPVHRVLEGEVMFDENVELAAPA